MIKPAYLFFFPIINKYFLMAKRSLLSRRPSYKHPPPCCVIRWDLIQVQSDMCHIGQCNVYIDCKNIHRMDNIKMYHLNGFLHCESYSILHISQLTCVIITMAICNNPEMNTQAKDSSIKKVALLHVLLNSSVELKCIKSEDN